ncbi:diguanylate cyclase [Billgrantia sp. LNSP4103-1]|uniref:diguanylate cyclase n=1 Tax=Billgrantia sp. LNSP4103-1 TaxID=3410266 RepID=UPI00403FB263
MARFHFDTTWHIAAPLGDVFDTLTDSLHWPDWWPGLVDVQLLEAGDDGGIGRTQRFIWKSRLGYYLRFDIRITHVQKPCLIEGLASGDVIGTGTWLLHETNAGTRVRYLWRVCTVRPWLNLLSQVARPLVLWNHRAMMQAGARGLSKHLRHIPEPAERAVESASSKQRWSSRSARGMLHPILSRSRRRDVMKGSNNSNEQERSTGEARGGDSSVDDCQRVRHELEKAREEIVRLNRTLHRIQQIARLGYWRASLKRNELYWSDVIYDIFGVSLSTFTPSIRAFKAMVHPDDLESVEASMWRAQESGIHDVEHRIVRPDGEVRWVHELADYVPEGDEQILIGTVRDITEQKRLELRLRQLSRTDELTGLFNRRYFMQRLVQELARYRRHGRTASVVLFDFDHFKRINDTHGHPAGDQTLVCVGKLLRERLRTSDTPARLGGEEFALLLPDTELEEATRVAEKVRQLVQEQEFTLEAGRGFGVSITCGVSAFRDTEETVEAILHRADQNLYQGKRAGRNRVVADEPAR